MSRIKKINNNKSQSLDYDLNVQKIDEYNVNVDPEIDWTTDVDLQMDPSKNDYNKGYTMDPYEMRYYANRNVLHQVKKGESYETIAEKYFGNKKYAHKIKEMNKELSSKKLKPGMMLIVGRKPGKTAAKEVRDIEYSPENLAKEIITLWSQADGPLQDFFNAFVVNKMTNEMRQQIADVINSWGYNVVPVLEDRTPRYASTKIKLFSKIAKIAKEKDTLKLFKELNKAFPKSKIISATLNDIEELQQNNIKIKKVEAQGLVDYYKQIFPDDYALSLVEITLEKPEISFEEFDDTREISDESLEQMERMDSGNQKSLSGPKDGGPNGYDFTTHMRPDGPGGVSPNSYETGPYNVFRANRIDNRIKKK